MAAVASGATWDSALPAGGVAAVRSVGFEPVGQVFGAAAYYLATVTGVSCPGTTGPSYPPSDTGPAGRLADSRLGGRRTALERMTAECAEIGAMRTPPLPTISPRRS
jgi:hypothetical protein